MISTILFAETWPIKRGLRHTLLSRSFQRNLSKLQSDLIPVEGSRVGIDLLSCSLFEHFFFSHWNNWKKIRPIWKIIVAEQFFTSVSFEGIIEISVCQVLNIILFLQRGDREAL